MSNQILGSDEFVLRCDDVQDLDAVCCTDSHIPQYGIHTSFESGDMQPACSCQIVLI